MSDSFKLFLIGGPTASGKSALAESLAEKFQIPLISADSRQFYRDMYIGTARPLPEGVPTVPYYLCGHLSIAQEYNIADFARDVYALIEKFRSHYRAALICGGSGLYLKAVCEGVDALPEANHALRAELKHIFEIEGISALQERLGLDQLLTLNESDRMNPQRLMRKIEIRESPASTHASKLLAPPSDLNIYKYFLNLPREVLYERIDQRVLQMMEIGLEAEARQLHPYKDLNSLQTVGYRELFDFFEGKITKAEAVAQIQQHTRNYAKRQVTWFSRCADYISGNAEEIKKDISEKILKMK